MAEAREIKERKLKLKVALVHDYIKEYGGAERVLETLHEMYPSAPVFTTVYCPEFLGPHKERFTNWDIRPSILQKIPFKHKLISPFRLLAPFVFPLFNFSGYDVVIVSATGAYSPNCIRIKKQELRIKEIDHKPFAISHKPTHICYYHTPPRYLYGLATAREWKKNPLIQLIGNLAFSWLRKVDIASSKHVDIAIANSQNVADRIKKFYHKDAVVVYPPIEIPSSKSQIPKSDYYLAGGRLARPKHIDFIIKACQELGAPLKVFGKGFAGYGEELQSLVIASEAKQSQETVIPAKAGIHPSTSSGKNWIPDQVRDDKENDRNDGSNIELLGEVTDEEKTALLAGAKAYIFAAEDEDFGMLPVEAMGAGTPVIAYKSGGPRESIVDGKTGIFFDELRVESLVRAIKKFETLTLSPDACKKQAKNFGKEEFVRRIQTVISSAVGRSNSSE